MFSRNFSRALIFALALAPAALLADRRVVARHGGHRATVTVHRGHPIHRPLPAVVVRPARTRVVVSAPLVFLPVVAFAAVAVAAPAPARLAWQDTELIHRNEDWVEANFGVNERGRELALQVSARTEVDFAEVTFQNGKVQVVDFNNRILTPGIYQLADFADGRHVANVRIIARAKAPESKLSVYMVK
jgi:hypothetical protein